MKNTFIAPEPITSNQYLPHLFLGGSIDNGKASKWQDFALRHIRSSNDSDQIIVLNPRRLNWNPHVVQEAADPVLQEQVTWELDAMERSDVILLWLEAGSMSPITLLELGLAAGQNHAGLLNKALVGCQPGFWRRGNVEIVCKRYRIPFVDTLEELLVNGVDMLGRNHQRRMTRLPT